jgi:hypothetical protein
MRDYFKVVSPGSYSLTDSNSNQYSSPIIQAAPAGPGSNLLPMAMGVPAKADFLFFFNQWWPLWVDPELDISLSVPATGEILTIFSTTQVRGYILSPFRKPFGLIPYSSHPKN